jgi:Ca2+-binding EF-hand superfamily protein
VKKLLTLSIIALTLACTQVVSAKFLWFGKRKDPVKKATEDQKEPYQCFRLQEIYFPLESFILVDRNRDGAISYSEVKVSNITLFLYIDKDKSGALKYEEFKLASSPLSMSEGCRTAEMIKLHDDAIKFEFNKIDLDKSKLISSDEFSKVAQLVFDLVDKDDNNFIDLLELKKHFLLMNKAFLPKDPEKIDVLQKREKVREAPKLSAADKARKTAEQERLTKEQKKAEAERASKELSDLYDNAWMDVQDILKAPAEADTQPKINFMYDDTAELIRKSEELRAADAAAKAAGQPVPSATNDNKSQSEAELKPQTNEKTKEFKPPPMKR